MRITGSNLQLASAHSSLQEHEVSESLKMWVGPRRPVFPGESERSAPPADVVRISDAGRQAQAGESVEETAEDALDGDPRMQLLRTMLEILTGERVRIVSASQLRTHGHTPDVATPAAANASPPQAAGFGVEYDFHESRTEIEQTAFSASGSVTTSDGREIAFQLDLSMSRSYHEESNVSLRLGDAARKTDPLVLNFAGTAAQLTDQRFAFDLDSDGQTEQINFVAPGSGFLVFDRNADGKVNNGTELFGPASNDGFAELSVLDSDQNGWIDENDPAFTALRIWTKDNDGNDQLSTLGTAGVGAIALTRVSTPFQLKTNANELLGEIRSSGIFLQENGAAGTIQQIDLTV